MDMICHTPYVLVVMTGLIILRVNVISIQVLAITPRNDELILPAVRIELVVWSIRTQLRSSALVYQHRRQMNGVPKRTMLSPPILWQLIWHVCLRPSVVRFLLTQDGDCVHPSSISPGGEGFNTPSQVNRWNVTGVLAGVSCGDYIYAPM